MRKKLSVLVAMLLATGTLSASEVAPFQKGERVLFLGASNTEIGLYISYLQLFQALRHSDRPVHMIYDWADSRTALEAAEKWLEKRSSTPWYNTNKKQVEQYRREKPREEEYRRQFTSAEEQMYQSAPMPVYEITIEPIE